MGHLTRPLFDMITQKFDDNVIETQHHPEHIPPKGNMGHNKMTRHTEGSPKRVSPCKNHIDVDGEAYISQQDWERVRHTLSYRHII